MSRDPLLHRRQSVRLQARDYSSPGHYYLTLCTQDRCHLFGTVSDGVMRLSELERAADLFWKDIPKHFPHAVLDEYVIMPNHVHGIIRIVDHTPSDVLPAIRALGIPIVPGLVMPETGAYKPYGFNVGANNWRAAQMAICPYNPYVRPYG